MAVLCDHPRDRSKRNRAPTRSGACYGTFTGDSAPARLPAHAAYTEALTPPGHVRHARGQQKRLRSAAEAVNWLRRASKRAQPVASRYALAQRQTRRVLELLSGDTFQAGDRVHIVMRRPSFGRPAILLHDATDSIHATLAATAMPRDDDERGNPILVRGEAAYNEASRVSRHRLRRTDDYRNATAKRGDLYQGRQYLPRAGV